MIQVTYTCTNCGREQTHEQDTLSEVADISVLYDGMDDCPETEYTDDPHHYGLTKVESDGSEVPMYDVLWVRATTLD